MEEKYYKVAESDLVAIADRTRVMANTKRKLTIDDIITWLGRVAYIPQGHVTSLGGNVTGLPATSSGILPTIYFGAATSSGGNVNSQPSTASGFLTEEGV